MFGSGRQKQSASKQAWGIRLLTNAYLVQGYFQPQDYESGGTDVFELAALGGEQGGLAAFQQLRLTQPQVQPTGNLAATADTFSEWGMPSLDQVIAIMPADEASLQSAKKAFKDYRYPFEAVVLAGPYRIRGKLLADSADRKRPPFGMTQILPLAEAEIDCLLPGARLTKFPVAWMLLNAGAALHGYGLL